MQLKCNQSQMQLDFEQNDRLTYVCWQYHQLALPTASTRIVWKWNDALFETVNSNCKCNWFWIVTEGPQTFSYWVLTTKSAFGSCFSIAIGPLVELPELVPTGHSVFPMLVTDSNFDNRMLWIISGFKADSDDIPWYLEVPNINIFCFNSKPSQIKLFQNWNAFQCNEA